MRKQQVVGSLFFPEYIYYRSIASFISSNRRSSELLEPTPLQTEMEKDLAEASWRY